MKKIILVLICFLLAGCYKKISETGETNFDIQLKKQNTSLLSVDEISKLKPQIHPPIKIAIASSSNYRGWSSEEMKEMLSWLPALKEIGFANEIVVIPQSLYSGCSDESSPDCHLKAVRTAAAGLHADAIILIGDKSSTYVYANPLSFLNLTIIGLWIVPGHNRDSFSVFDAAIIDTSNSYLYGIARGEGAVEKISPYMFGDSRRGQSEAEMLALKQLGQQVLEQAKAIMKNKKYKP